MWSFDVRTNGKDSYKVLKYKEFCNDFCKVLKSKEFGKDFCKVLKYKNFDIRYIKIKSKNWRKHRKQMLFCYMGWPEYVIVSSP